MINKFFFYPRENNSSCIRKFKDAEIILNVNGQQLQGWFVRAEGDEAPVVIYYGGNAEDVSICLLDLYPPQPVTTVLMNYRGFGGSSGKPTQEGLFADALAIYDHLVNTLNVNPKKICLVGRSIGSSIAAYVASQRQVEKLVLVTPFDSVANVIPKFLQWIPPIKICLRKYFNTTKYLESFKGKFLVVAAERDEIIPRRCLEALLKKFHHQILFVDVVNANHQDILEQLQCSEAIEKYIHDF